MLFDLFPRPAPSDPDPDDPDARHALAALMVRIARSDDDYAEIEKARIDAILKARFGLGDGAAVALRAAGEGLEASANDTVQFTRAIKEAVPLEDRDTVIEALWAVVLADGVRAPEEDGLLRLIANLLGINDRDSALARQRVASALDP